MQYVLTADECNQLIECVSAWKSQPGNEGLVEAMFASGLARDKEAAKLEQTLAIKKMEGRLKERLERAILLQAKLIMLRDELRRGELGGTVPAAECTPVEPTTVSVDLGPFGRATAPLEPAARARFSPHFRPDGFWVWEIRDRWTADRPHRVDQEVYDRLPPGVEGMRGIYSTAKEAMAALDVALAASDRSAAAEPTAIEGAAP